MKPTSPLLRRDFLKTGGAFVVSFLFNPSIPDALAQTKKPPVEAGKRVVDIHEVDSFLEIHRDGSVTIYTGKVDLGTGLRIAVRQMAAEELGVQIARVDLVEGDTAMTPDQGRTGGSSGLVQGGVGVRQAAATARQRILELASKKLDRPLSSLVLRDGQVTSSVGGPTLNVADLAPEKAFALKVDPKVILKDPKTYTVVGKSIPRPDVPGKCTGKHTYVHDFRLPGMLHGRVIHPPARGATLVSVDESSVAGIPEVRVVRIKNFLGVVAKDEWAAMKASSTLKAKWSDWQGLPTTEELPAFVRECKVDHEEKPVSRGDSKTALAGAAKKFSASYYFPYQGHASMGPSCAVADVQPDSITIWTASQSTHLFRTVFAESFNLPESQVRLIYLDGSGCYGQNAHEDAAGDAAILSKAAGSPVRVQWTRQDEHGWDPKGPPEVIDMRAGVGPDGKIVAWETELWVPTPISTKGTIPLVGLDAAEIKQRQGRWPGSVDENLDPPYTAANVNVMVHRLKDSPLRTGHVRAPGKVASAWAVESLTEELAVSAGMDSVAYRLQGLTDPRAIDVVKRTAEMLNWRPRPSPNRAATSGKPLSGRGISYVRYRGNENYVAVAMDVTVNPSTGKIAIQRVVCAHDCGLVVNPDALKNQIEGSIIQTLSKMIYEEVKLDRSAVTSVDWASYPVIRFPDVPPIEVSLLDRPALPLYGAGEASMTPVGGALANAVFDAAGIRLRTVPFTPERVKAALAGKRA